MKSQKEKFQATRSTTYIKEYELAASHVPSMKNNEFIPLLDEDVNWTPLLEENPKMSTSNPYESLIKAEEKHTILGMFKDVITNLKVSLPSIFSVGDYLLVVIILKSLVANNRNLEFTAATGYMTAYFSLMYFAVSQGVNESVGIYCAQAWGSKDKKDRGRMFLMLKQAFLFLFLNYICSVIPMTFFVKSFLLEVVNVNMKTADYTQMLIYYCLPALFIRGLTDILKSYAQA
jgi:Na+-driven multidrug efflux pump